MTKTADLLPCPFCGTQPNLPDGDGTQYEIWCEDCGGAVAAVQICDLMTLEERAADSFKDYRYGEVFVERAKLEAIDKWNTRTAPAEDVRAVVEEPVAVRDFANELISAAYEGGAFDAGDIQDLAVKHGLLSIKPRAEACGESCRCSEYGFPTECLRKTSLLKPAQ